MTSARRGPAGERSILVVTAVEAERAAVLAAAPDATVVTVGVGCAAAAAGTAAALATGSWDLVLCAGIGGGFPPLAPGDVAVASAIVFADLGVETGEAPRDPRGPCDVGGFGGFGGFAPIASTGFGTGRYEVDRAYAVDLARRCDAHLGTVLTVATVTGTAATAARRANRFPDAVAEAMEGAGVAAAASLFGLPVAEIRAVSNRVGPRDRAAWQVPQALAALGKAAAELLGTP